MYKGKIVRKFIQKSKLKLKSKKIVCVSYLFASALCFNMLYVDFCIASQESLEFIESMNRLKNSNTMQSNQMREAAESLKIIQGVSPVQESTLADDGGLIEKNEFSGENDIYDDFDSEDVYPLNKEDIPAYDLDAISPKNENEAVGQTQRNTQNIEYSMTDAKHKKFRREHNAYALVDSMLNFTWDALKKQSIREVFSRNLKEQRLWVKGKRDAVASSFSIHLGEADAFTLAMVARTQELAAHVFMPPEAGVYFYTQGGNAQGGHIVVKVEGTSVSISGQSFAKSGNACEIEGKGIVTGKVSTSFTTQKDEKFYVLFAKDAIYMVHGKIALCGKKVSFQGRYEKKAKAKAQAKVQVKEKE